MTTPNARRRFVRLLAPLAVLGLVTAACGSDDDSSSSDTEPAATDAAIGHDGATSHHRAPTAPPTMTDGPTIRPRPGLQRVDHDRRGVRPVPARPRATPSRSSPRPASDPTTSNGVENGDFNLIIDYIGGVQAALAPDAAAAADADEIVANIIEPVEAIGATLLDYSPAVDGDAFVVRGDSEASTISDVAGLDYVLGGSAQCPERPQCLIGLEDPDIYGITFADFVTLEFGPLLGEALANNEVDAVIWNTTAPQITEQGFKVLEDDQGIFPAQNIAPIITTEVLVAYGDQLAADLNELSAVDHHRRPARLEHRDRHRIPRVRRGRHRMAGGQGSPLITTMG